MGGKNSKFEVYNFARTGKKLFKMFDTMKFLKIMLKIVNNTMPLRIKSVIKKRDGKTQY